MVKISDLRMLDIINIADGRRLGTISDVEVDVEQGAVQGLLLPGGSKGWLLFQHREEKLIPWDKIVNMGEDVILVHLEEKSMFSIPEAESETFC